MQALFKEIVDGDIGAVRQRLVKDPGLTALVATAPPKQYAQQSPLQVAYRNGEFAIAALLLEHGADPNFIEADSPHTFVMPALHHAIKAAVMRSRWLRPTRFAKESTEEVWQMRNTAERADEAYAALQLLMESGADIHAVDSSGNSALGRAVLDARQILPTRRYNDPDWVDPKPLNPELVDDLTRVFDLLLAHGADPDRVEPNLSKSIAEFYSAEAVSQFIRNSSSS
ncbi:hypothetical protein [Aeromicrobium sp. P5_D10]